MRLPILAVAAVALATASVSAAEISVPTSARDALSVTLYSGGFGLVKDRRTTSLAAGSQTVAFEGISAKMVPSSALLRAGVGVRVLEQNFEHDVISPKTLLERSGAVLTFENRAIPERGAVVRVRWGRLDFEQPLTYAA